MSSDRKTKVIRYLREAIKELEQDDEVDTIEALKTLARAYSNISPTSEVPTQEDAHVLPNPIERRRAIKKKMNRLSYSQARSCEYAGSGDCRCRCKGTLHGAARNSPDRLPKIDLHFAARSTWSARPRHAEPLAAADQTALSCDQNPPTNPLTKANPPN